MDEADDFFERAIKWYLIRKFLLGCLALFIFIMIGTAFIVYWIFDEVSREMQYRDKYGADWQTEFEKYHGTLAHAHTQLAVCVTNILALVAVLTWFCKQTFHRHQKHMHQYRGSRLE